MKRIALILLLTLLLAGAAFIGMRMLNGEGLPAGIAGLSGSHLVRLVRSTELPTTDPDLIGVLVRRQDNSLFVGTGNVKFQTIRENDSAPARFEKGYDGPVVEIVVTRQTQVFYDVTDPSTAGEDTIQQVIRPGTLDELGEDHFIQAWGPRQGDRVIAAILAIYSPPLTH